MIHLHSKAKLNSFTRENDVRSIGMNCRVYIEVPSCFKLPPYLVYLIDKNNELHHISTLTWNVNSRNIWNFAEARYELYKLLDHHWELCKLTDTTDELIKTIQEHINTDIIMRINPDSLQVDESELEMVLKCEDNDTNMDKHKDTDTEYIQSVTSVTSVTLPDDALRKYVMNKDGEYDDESIFSHLLGSTKTGRTDVSTRPRSSSENIETSCTTEGGSSTFRVDNITSSPHITDEMYFQNRKKLEMLRQQRHNKVCDKPSKLTKTKSAISAADEIKLKTLLMRQHSNIRW